MSASGTRRVAMVRWDNRHCRSISTGARLDNDHARYHRGNRRGRLTSCTNWHYEPFSRCNRTARVQHAFASLGTHTLAQGPRSNCSKVQTVFELVWWPSEISDSEPATPADYGRAADKALRAGHIEAAEHFIELAYLISDANGIFCQEVIYRRRIH